MPKYYVLVKRTGAKSWQVAIPARSGVSKARLSSVIAKSRKKGYSYRIATDTELKRLLKSKPRRRRKSTKRRKSQKRK